MEMLIPIAELEALVKKFEHEISNYEPGGIPYSDSDEGYAGGMRHAIYEVKKTIKKYSENKVTKKVKQQIKSMEDSTKIVKGDTVVVNKEKVRYSDLDNLTGVVQGFRWNDEAIILWSDGQTKNVWTDRLIKVVKG